MTFMKQQYWNEPSLSLSLRSTACLQRRQTKRTHHCRRCQNQRHSKVCWKLYSLLLIYQNAPMTQNSHTDDVCLGTADSEERQYLRSAREAQLRGYSAVALQEVCCDWVCWRFLYINNLLYVFCCCVLVCQRFARGAALCRIAAWSSHELVQVCCCCFKLLGFCFFFFLSRLSFVS